MPPSPAPDAPHAGPLARALPFASAWPFARAAAAWAARRYERELARRNARFDAGRGVVTIDRPVISIGNLSVGGTGKSPMVAHALRLLRAAGHNPAVAMRGYRAHAGLSDEADAHARAFPDLPLVARPDRLEGLIELFATEAGERVDCVVLDDGFQHRRIARQADIVLIDATRPPFADACLPVGWLREPPASLRRSTAVVLTHADRVPRAALDALQRDVQAAAGRPPIALAQHAWEGVDVASADLQGEASHPVAWLAGRRVVAVCAVARPQTFLASLAEAGARVAEAIVLADHAPVGEALVRRVALAAARCNADAVVMTDKDWSKWRRRLLRRAASAAGAGAETALAGIAIARPRLHLAFLAGAGDLAQHILHAAECAEAEDDPAA